MPGCIFFVCGLLTWTMVTLTFCPAHFFSFSPKRSTRKSKFVALSPRGFSNPLIRRTGRVPIRVVISSNDSISNACPFFTSSGPRNSAFGKYLERSAKMIFPSAIADRARGRKCNFHVARGIRPRTARQPDYSSIRKPTRIHNETRKVRSNTSA